MDLFSHISAYVATIRDGFIPWAQFEGSADLDTIYRYQLLSSMLLVALAALIAFTCYFPFFIQGELASVIINSIICLSLSTCLLVFLYKLKKGASYTGVVHGFVGSIYLAISAGIIFTGGIHGSNAPVFLPLPVILAFLLSNKKSALAYAAATLLIYTVLVQLDAMGVKLPQVIEHKNLKSVETVLWFYYSLMLIALVMLYDSLTQRLFVQRHEERIKLSYIATHDDLTSLANRKQFDIKLNEAMHRAKRLEGFEVALLLIDLNDFKPINDLNGHHVGDEMLRHVAQQMLKTTRADDVTARIGGDEFAVIVQGENTVNQLAVFATRLCHNISTPLAIGDKMHSVTASVGIAQYPNTRDEEHLRNAADMAMYAAKQAKKDFLFFDDLEK